MYFCTCGSVYVSFQICLSVNVSFSLFPKSVLGMFFVDQDATGGVASDHK